IQLYTIYIQSVSHSYSSFLLNHTPTTDIYTLSLHDALPILRKDKEKVLGEHFDDERIKSFFTYDAPAGIDPDYHLLEKAYRGMRSEEHTSELQSRENLVCRLLLEKKKKNKKQKNT